VVVDVDVVVVVTALGTALSMNLCAVTQESTSDSPSALIP
jgi:hypothetical protein